MRLGVLLTHPVQYFSPWFANLAKRIDLSVFYALQQTPDGQARAGFDVAFEWDIPLLDGYSHRFLPNVSRDPGLHHFSGCDNPSVKDVIAAAQFDAFLVYGWNRKCYWQAILAARRHRLPVLIRTDTQLDSPRHWSWRAAKLLAYRGLLPRLGDYLYPGERTRRYLRRYGVPAWRMHYLPHMVDTARIGTAARHARASGERESLRSQAGATAADIILLFVGKLVPKKRPDRLLQSFSRFVTSFSGAPRCQLWFVGDGPLRIELQQSAAQRNLPVKFFGFVNQTKLPSFYAAADLLVLPSDSGETWGLVVNEAFAAGIPAIVSQDVGCAETMIEPGRTGWIYDGTEPALVQTLATAAAQAHTVSADAIARISDLHSLDAGTERMLEILDVVTRRTHPPHAVARLPA